MGYLTKNKKKALKLIRSAKYEVWSVDKKGRKKEFIGGALWGGLLVEKISGLFD